MSGFAGMSALITHRSRDVAHKLNAHNLQAKSDAQESIFD